MVELIQETPLDEAVRRLMPGPLGMTDTGFVARKPQRMATAYVNDTPPPHRLTEGEIVLPF